MRRSTLSIGSGASLFTTLLISILLLIQTIIPTHAFDYRTLTTVDIASPHSLVNIDTPNEMSGSFYYSHTSAAGPMFNASGPEYHTQARFVLPHSADGLNACKPMTRLVNDEGESLIGSFLMIERGGGCNFAPKFENVMKLFGPGDLAAIVIYGCSVETGCEDGLLGLSAFETWPVPGIFVASGDGQVLKQYLLDRRASYAALTVNGTLTQPAACDDPLNQQSRANATANGCVLPPLGGWVFGTSELVNPAEGEALRTLASALTFDESYFNDITWLRAWTDYLAHPEIDPCTSRLTGLWCEQGHIISIDLTALGVSGNIPANSLKAMTELKFIVLYNNYIEGALPEDLCWLSKVEVAQFDSNQFTSLPECIGSVLTHAS